MNRRLCLSSGFALLAVAGLARAERDAIYDEKADAQKQVARAIAEASRSGKNIVLIFGANWCPDCHALDAQMHRAELTSLIAKNFVIVEIDVGRFDKNLDLGDKYGVPIKKEGIPALTVLDSQGKPLHAQDQEHFADARHIPYESIAAILREVEAQKLISASRLRASVVYEAQSRRGVELANSSHPK